MKLYIIGNGFDLNHGRKTSYRNYRDFLEENYPEIIRKFEALEYIRGAEWDKDSRWDDLEVNGEN